MQAVRLGLDRVNGLSAEAGRAHRRRARRGAASRAPKTWRGAPASTPTSSRRWPRPTRCRASPATATRRRGRSPASTPGRPRCCARPASTRRAVALAAPSEAEDTLADYRALGLTLNRHPLALLRERARAVPDRAGRGAAHLSERAAGARQRPGHAPPAARDRQGHGLRHPRGRDRRGQRHRLGRRSPRRSASRCSARRCSPSTASGSARARASRPVMHLLAMKMIDHTPLLQGLVSRSRDFR